MPVQAATAPLAVPAVQVGELVESADAAFTASESSDDTEEQRWLVSGKCLLRE